MIISLTTLPSRINHIEAGINSLKEQGFPIYLWIPKYVKRLNQKFDGKIPNFLNGINYEVVEDRGSITKLLGGLEVANNVLMTADDDVIYPKDWAKKLIDYYDSLTQKGVCCYRGREFKGKKMTSYRNTRLVEKHKVVRKVNIVCGTWGVLYHKDMFTKDIFVLKHHMVDDIVISCELHKNNVSIWCLPSNNSIRPYAICRKDSLWGYNRKGNNNDNALKDLW